MGVVADSAKPLRVALPKGKVSKALTNLSRGKQYYKKADAAMDEVLERLPRCGTCGGVMAANITVTLRSGKKFKLVDNFAEKHRTNVGQNARRFEFEEVPAP
jgi:hypothetical protein